MSKLNQEVSDFLKSTARQLARAGYDQPHSAQSLASSSGGASRGSFTPASTPEGSAPNNGSNPLSAVMSVFSSLGSLF